MNKLFEKIQDLYWKCWPRILRPEEIWYTIKCNLWYKYRTVKPRTLEGQAWCDRDILLAHTCFEILTQFMEKELKGYRPEELAYFYTDRQDDLVDFRGTKKDPYYVLDYLYRWWKFYLNKSGSTSFFDKFHSQHCKIEFNRAKETEFFSLDTIWDSPENEKTGIKLHKRHTKKIQNLEQELDENLILLMKLRRFMWT